jgi:hypothetical protein
MGGFALFHPWSSTWQMTFLCLSIFSGALSSLYAYSSKSNNTVGDRKERSVQENTTSSWADAVASTKALPTMSRNCPACSTFKGWSSRHF